MTGSTLNLMISPMAMTIAIAVWRATMGLLLPSGLTRCEHHHIQDRFAEGGPARRRRVLRSGAKMPSTAREITLRFLAAPTDADIPAVSAVVGCWSGSTRRGMPVRWDGGTTA